MWLFQRKPLTKNFLAYLQVSLSFHALVSPIYSASVFFSDHLCLCSPCNLCSGRIPSASSSGLLQSFVCTQLNDQTVRISSQTVPSLTVFSNVGLLLTSCGRLILLNSPLVHPLYQHINVLLLNHIQPQENSWKNSKRLSKKSLHDLVNLSKYRITCKESRGNITVLLNC